MTESKIGKVEKLFITNIDKRRVSMEKIAVDDFGIIHDKFYAKNQMRSILITSMQSYTLAIKNSINIEHGSLGENILIDINPYTLKIGSHLKIGATILEITQNCTICQGLSKVDINLPKLLKNDRGIFAKVINGNSEIKLGDNIELISKH